MHRLLEQSFTLNSSKIEISNPDFFYVVTTQNDQSSHAKYVLVTILM